ncbi:MAG: hypothetical protein HN623_12685, partial [Bdellovibrionales bacterium]|nr:hypothetical protein [Bdellovibrionales bacterium]
MYFFAFKRVITVCAIFSLSFNLLSAEVTLSDLQIAEQQEVSVGLAAPQKTSTLLSTKNLAWGTMALLGAAALTGREQKVNPIHISLASLSAMSYGFFMNSYCSTTY